MDNVSSHQRTILRDYSRAVVHARNQHDINRFALIFGAGLNKSVGLPSWEELVNSIANDPDVSAKEIIKDSPPRAALSYTTEMLFQHYRKKTLPMLLFTDEREREFEIAGKWMELVRKHLYRTAPSNFKEVLEKHPYLKQLLPIIKSSHMTVTYNFDDYIERAIYETRTAAEKKVSRGYEIVTNPWTQFKRKDSIIYHPNGIVTLGPMESPSDRVILSESSFAEQLIGHANGDSAGLLNHLSKNTCLFIGLSLEDETLRAVLIKSARQNPGNYHYYVMFAGGGIALTEDTKEAIRRTNFRVYNLITLFLDDSGIAALAELITTDEDKFCDWCQECGVDPNYRYYVTGPLGVGKSTTINNMRNLVVYDEWLEKRPEILAKPWDELTSKEKDEADNWIMQQFKLKNDTIRHKKCGIFLIDRAPMDPLAFTKKAERPAKAKKLLSAYSPGKATYTVMPGKVIFMTGPHKELALRMKITNRVGYTDIKLMEMEQDLLEVYGKDNVILVDTYGLTVEEVVKRIAEIIHFDTYESVDIHNLLEVHGATV